MLPVKIDGLIISGDMIVVEGLKTADLVSCSGIELAGIVDGFFQTS